MKTLLLIRHAKSSWDDASLSDFERPLNERGKTDAPQMAKRLAKKKIKIDAFISSPAKRAKRTAGYFIKDFGKEKDEIILISSLYDAGLNDFLQAVQNVNDQYDCVALFSHNPGITSFANHLIKDANLNNMPTCSIFAVKAEANKWKDFIKTKKEFLFFDYPKKPEELE